MTPLVIAVLVFLALVETLASYISRVYAEFGKILTREIEENLDAWEELVEPQLGLSREHAAISAAVLQQLALGLIALEFGAVLFDRGPLFDRPTPAEIARRFSPWCWSSSSATRFCPLCSSTAPVAAGPRA
jgi:putative hemolysin